MNLNNRTKLREVIRHWLTNVSKELKNKRTKKWKKLKRKHCSCTWFRCSGICTPSRTHFKPSRRNYLNLRKTWSKRVEVSYQESLHTTNYMCHSQKLIKKKKRKMIRSSKLEIALLSKKFTTINATEYSEGLSIFTLMGRMGQLNFGILMTWVTSVL